MAKFQDKKYFAALCVILSAAFFLRVYFFAADSIITTDGVAYALSGRNLIENGRYEIFKEPQLTFPPGYPIVIGLIDHFYKDPYFAAKLTSFLFGLLTVYIFYLVGTELGGKKAGLYASIVSAMDMHLVLASFKIGSESMYIAFVLLAVYMYYRLIREYQDRFSIALGLSIGISYLIRPEGIVLLILLFFFLLRSRGRVSARNIARGAVIIFTSFFIIFLSYVSFIYRHTGELSFSNKAKANLIVNTIFDGNEMSDISASQYNLYEKVFFNYDQSNMAIALPHEFDDINLFGTIKNDPIFFLKLFGRGFLSEMKMLLVEYKAAMLLMIAAIAYLSALVFKRSFSDKIFELALLAALMLAIFPIYHIEERYLLQPFVFIILIASCGMSLSEKGFFADNHALKNCSKLILLVSKTLVLSLVITFFSLALYSLISYKEDNSGAGYRRVAEFIKKDSGHSYESNVIMSRKPIVAFYAESVKSVAIPYTSAENILKFAKANKVNYVVIDKRFLGIRDNYEELENLGNYSDKASLVFQENSVYPIKVFKVSP